MITTGDIKISVLVGRADGGERAPAPFIRPLQLRQASRPGADAAGIGHAQRLSRRVSGRCWTEIGGRDLASITQKLSSMEDIVVSDVLLGVRPGTHRRFSTLPDEAGHLLARFSSGGGRRRSSWMVIVQKLRRPESRNHLSFSVMPRERSPERALQVTGALVQTLDPACQEASRMLIWPISS